MKTSKKKYMKNWLIIAGLFLALSLFVIKAIDTVIPELFYMKMMNTSSFYSNTCGNRMLYYWDKLNIDTDEEELEKDKQLFLTYYLSLECDGAVGADIFLGALSSKSAIWLADNDGKLIVSGNMAFVSRRTDLSVYSEPSFGCFRIDDVLTEDQASIIQGYIQQGANIHVDSYVLDGLFCYPLSMSVVINGETVHSISCLPHDGEVITEDNVWIYSPLGTSWTMNDFDKYAMDSVMNIYKNSLSENGFQFNTENGGGYSIHNISAYQYLSSDYGYLCQGYFLNMKQIYRVLVSIIIFILLIICLIVGGLLTLTEYKDNKRLEYEKNVSNALAHDIKSSLMVVSGYSENLIREKDKNKQQHFCEEIIMETENMNQMTERMLTLTRTQGKGFEINKTDLSICDITKKLCKRYLEKSADRGVTINIDCDVDWILSADEQILEMILDNFISNAVNYSLKGSVITVIIKPNKFMISNSWTPDEKIIKKPSLIWEPYTTGNKARTASHGNGVGLSIADNLLTYHKLYHGVNATKEEITFWFSDKKKY